MVAVAQAGKDVSPTKEAKDARRQSIEEFIGTIHIFRKHNRGKGGLENGIFYLVSVI